MTARLGEYISLSWGDWGPPDFYAVRGHVSVADYREAVGADVPGPIPTEAEHQWARWCQTALSNREGWTGELRIYSEPGRGRFPVTVGYPHNAVSEVECHD